MKLVSSKICSNLNEQGFTFLSVEEKSRLNVAFRITPTVCSLVVGVGIYYQSWQVFAVLFIFGLLGTFTKSYQPIDFLYNTVLNRVFSWPKLPPSPAPKRFACLIGATFLAGAAISFYLNVILWAYIFAIFYILAAGLMAATHYCVGSWIYHNILRK